MTGQGAVAHRNCMNPDCLAEEGDRHQADCTPDASGRACSCGKPFPEDGGKEGVCECCSGCASGRVRSCDHGASYGNSDGTRTCILTGCGVTFPAYEWDRPEADEGRTPSPDESHVWPPAYIGESVGGPRRYGLREATRHAALTLRRPPQAECGVLLRDPKWSGTYWCKPPTCKKCLAALAESAPAREQS